MYKINSHPDRVSVPDEAVKAGGRSRLWFRKTKDPNVSTTAPSCWAEDGRLAVWANPHDSGTS